MHGRLKVRTTEQEQERKRKEREQKVKIYKAVMAKISQKRKDGEMDDEMLSLTSQTLCKNPDIYTLWNIRREIFLQFKKDRTDEEMGSFVDNEVRLTENCLQVNPKSYCAWFHRAWVLDLHPKPNWKRELALCTKFLMMDARNFHCWDYRRLAAEKSGVSPMDEFEFTTEKIHDNFSNYSAWHYRSKLLPLTHPDAAAVALIDPEKHRQELELVQNAAFTDPNDTSAWFYQRWLLGADCSVNRRPKSLPLLATVDAERAVVSFSSPSPQAPKIMVNQTELQGSWNRCSEFVWTLRRSSDEKLEGSEIEVVGENGSLALKSTPEGSYKGVSPDATFGSEHNPVVMAELKGQLVCCQQLLQLEPDSKWTLLTSVLLMQAIDNIQYHGDSMQALEKLIKFDPMHIGYYNDLRSKYVLELKLSMNEDWTSGAASAVQLSSSQLSCLYYSNRFALVREIDLSDNELSDYALRSLGSLQLCQKLDLHANKLTALAGFPHLPCLNHLNVANNQLEQPAVVEESLRKADLKLLKEIIVDGNPCSETEEIQSLVKNLCLSD